MKIAIRAEGGPQIGMGHIMRTLVLAKELSKKHEVFYLNRNNKVGDLFQYKNGMDKIISEGFSVKLLDENSNFEDLRHIDADLLITDSYDVDDKYFNLTKKIFKKTAYIDDMNLYYFNVDFLINQNINALDLKYMVNEQTELLLGHKYVMLREEFREIPEKYINKEVKDVLITMGGADPFNVTSCILKCVDKLNFNFHVVVGSSFNNIEELNTLEKENVKLYFNADMYKLMQKCDIAISACGSTLYELSFCGVPTIGIIVADNQRGIAEKFNELGIIELIGEKNSIKNEKFIKCLSDLADDYKKRCKMSELAQKLVDGRGAKRIAKAITTL